MAKELTFPVGDARLDDFMKLAVKKFPKTKVYDKRSSAFMWLLYVVGFMWIWQRKFMDSFNTTIGFKVYITRKSIEAKWWRSIYGTMRHEFIHMLQRGKYKLLYDISYLFPQILAPVALLAILAVWFSNAWLYSLFALAMLAPLPAPWRTKWELEGYTASMLTDWEEEHRISKNRIDRVISRFTGSSYYFMFPFKSYITRKVNNIVAAILEGKITGIFLHY